MAEAPPQGIRVALTLLCIALASPTIAADETKTASKTRWGGEIGTGLEYDTNVTVDEVDLSSGQADTAWVMDFELGLKHDFNEKTAASLTYNFSQSNYAEFSRVDRRTQIVGADVSHDLGSSNAGLSVYYIDSLLDGDPFLRFVRVSPSLSGFLAKKWFARSAYVYSEREIEERIERDAITHTGEFDLYYFHRGLRSYLNLGYRYRDEDAVASEFDFTAHSLKLRYIRRVDFWGKKAKAEFAVRYEVRDYLSNEPTINVPRQDDRVRWKLDFEVPISKRLTWQSYYSYGDYVSNLPRADFTQNIIGSRLQFKW